MDLFSAWRNFLLLIGARRPLEVTPGAAPVRLEEKPLAPAHIEPIEDEA